MEHLSRCTSQTWNHLLRSKTARVRGPKIPFSIASKNLKLHQMDFEVARPLDALQQLAPDEPVASTNDLLGSKKIYLTIPLPGIQRDKHGKPRHLPKMRQQNLQTTARITVAYECDVHELRRQTPLSPRSYPGLNQPYRILYFHYLALCFRRWFRQRFQWNLHNQRPSTGNKIWRPLVVVSGARLYIRRNTWKIFYSARKKSQVDTLTFTQALRSCNERPTSRATRASHL